MWEKARSDLERITNNKVGASAAKTIAKELTVRHVVEYIIHIQQQEEDTHEQQEEAREDTPEAIGVSARLD
ncbi:MAG: hypothetical protein ACKPKO_19305, partial [Candidatus Fonsibacter sp.]